LRSNIGTAPGGPHTPFNSTPLRRLLAGWAAAAPTTGTGTGEGVAERLGHWLAWTDAVDLSAALNQPPAPTADGATGAPPVAVLAQALAKLQADQARLISTDPVYLPGNGTGALDDDDLAPYRRAAQARQRAMAAAVTPLRARLRAALAAGSPAQAQLAALDATLEAALTGRERTALAGVVGQIERRARTLRASAATDWRTRFHHDMQQTLLAELDLRLQPLHGLLDALREEATA
jgi:hypothetical protein